LPESSDSLVIRTDFLHDEAWQRLRAEIAAPVAVPYPNGAVDEFQAYVEFIDDRTYDGVTATDLVAGDFERGERSFVFLVDTVAHTHPEYPILVVDLLDEPGRTFRVVPNEAWGVENNLSIANMDFCEFADNADADGIFRGFPD
jgi:hypothetical protein